MRLRRNMGRPAPTGPRVNRDIRVSEVRVIDDEGEQLGVMPIEEAIAAAEDQDLDLVEVAPNSSPPVCKIMDFGRYKYVQQKKAHEARKRQKVVEVKEVKMRIKIDDHDYGFKRRNAERFLLDGDKVKATIMFRGREVTHPELGRKLLDRMANDLIEISAVEQMPSLEGRNMTMLLVPKANRATKGSGPGKKEEKKGEPKEEALKAPLADALAEATEEEAAGGSSSEDGTETKEGT